MSAASKAPRVTAETLGKKQREISVSEFFAKNRHLLGFDSLRKALLTAVKEAVDNSLDACEEAGILPELWVWVDATPQEKRFVVTVRDNGPGIVPQQIPNIFGKLLYGSKFHSMKQSRGQQGIGISAAAMYGQLTTGKAVEVISRTGRRKAAHRMEVLIDTASNQPKVTSDKTESEWDLDHGTQIRIELEGQYLKGRQSIDEFLFQVAVANPHASVHYRNPLGEEQHFARTVDHNPEPPREIKPHPHGVELGVLMKMLHASRQTTIHSFLTQDFSRVSPRLAGEILERARIKPRSRPKTIVRNEVEALYRAINHEDTRILAPPTSCLSPIGMQELLAGLTRRVRAEFYTVETRRPAVYRGNPFQVEVGLAWGGDLPPEELARVLRFANRVPLLYQAGACCITKAVNEVAWRGYGLQQSRGALPTGPLVVLVHLASVWVPFSSESKEAVADYDEIRKEIKLGVQACGRRLGQYVSRRARARGEAKRREVFELYLEEVASCVESILGASQDGFRKSLLAISRRKTELADTLEDSGGDDEAAALEDSSRVLIVDRGDDDEPEPALAAAVEREPEQAALELE
jgi:DNA topoisomerase-6 subunit B